MRRRSRPRMYYEILTHLSTGQKRLTPLLSKCNLENNYQRAETCLSTLKNNQHIKIDKKERNTTITATPEGLHALSLLEQLKQAGLLEV